ncbi:hypothetical protein HY387_00690 [Candidatus Daviesbacteria bacterium]|nr:hypothetical protein [Candidatus Daviesbacteria bacterium]
MIWFVLFFVIIAASFVLAYFSMKDFEEIPEPREAFGLFLIKTPQNLTTRLLDSLFLKSAHQGHVISLERLFKGEKSALLIFGHKDTLNEFSELNLLELEDYTTKDLSTLMAWEMTKTNSLEEAGEVFGNFPPLKNEEQFWWQVLIRPHPSKDWQGKLRAIVLSPDEYRRKKLTESLQQTLSAAKLVKQPRPLTSQQIYDSFMRRSISPMPQLMSLTTKEIMHLLGKV